MNCVESYFASDFCGSERPAIVFFDGLKALKHPNKSVSFKRLSLNAVKAQQWLRQKGFAPGDSVLMFEAPSPDMYAMILALLGSGVQLMLVEPWLPLSHINALIEKVRPKGFMAKTIGKLWGLRSQGVRSVPIWFSSSVIGEAPARFGAASFEIENMDPEANAILTFTSGTSSSPKGVHRKHKFLVDQAAVIGKHLHYEANGAMDLTVFTNVALLNLGLGKGSLLVPHSWSPKILRQLDKLPPTHVVDTLACGPGFLLRLMDCAQVGALKSFHLGGALADCWIYEKAFERWPNAAFTHVYGSSEAEPVALADLKAAVAASRKNNKFQTLFLGRPIEDVQISNDENALWVAGPHVSPMYEGDERANAANKRADGQGRVWHNMGDRILQDGQGLWYGGRSFQMPEDFELEQAIYQKLGHSKCFVFRRGNDVCLFGEFTPPQMKDIQSNCPQISKIFCGKIFRDKRHRSRIDRAKSLQKKGCA